MSHLDALDLVVKSSGISYLDSQSYIAWFGALIYLIYVPWISVVRRSIINLVLWN